MGNKPILNRHYVTLILLMIYLPKRKLTGWFKTLLLAVLTFSLVVACSSQSAVENRHNPLRELKFGIDNCLPSQYVASSQYVALDEH